MVMNLNGPRLPVEVIEKIIDSCVFYAGVSHYQHVLSSYRLLRACSLICRDLLPRCRRNLYWVVVVTCSDQADKLCATLNINPCLGEHIRALRIDHKGGPLRARYISFARHELVSKLPNVRTLALHMDWNDYPPRYHNLVSLYFPITEIFMWKPRNGNLFHTFRVLSTFRWLERLHVYPRLEHGHADGQTSILDPGLWNLAMQSQKMWFPSSDTWRLRTSFNGARRATYHHYTVSAARWLSWSCTGSIAVRFKADGTKLVSQWPILEKLTLVEDILVPLLADGRHLFSAWATPFISSTRSHPSLRQISFRIWPHKTQSGVIAAPGDSMFLHKVFDYEWVHVCGKLKSPPTFVFSLPRSMINAGTSDWWAIAIQARLQSVKVRVLVELCTYGVDWADTCPWIATDRNRSVQSDLCEWPRGPRLWRQWEAAAPVIHGASAGRTFNMQHVNAQNVDQDEDQTRNSGCDAVMEA